MDVNILLRGQSNALLFADFGGAARLEQGLEAALPGVDVHLLYRWNDGGGANTIVGGSAFLTEWMYGASAGPLERGLLRYIQGQPAGIKANPTLELWMHNESDQNARGFTADHWKAVYGANKALVEQAFGHPVATEFVPVRYNFGDIGPILDGMKLAVADGKAAGIDMSAYDLAKMDYGGTPNTEHMSASDARVVADALAQNLAPLVASLAGGPAGTRALAPAAAAAEATRYYEAVLDRPPDAGGLAHWVQAREQGATPGRMADGLVGSAEFGARYGALSSQGFVELLYHNALDRPGDSDGTAHWTAALDAGALSRADVVGGVASSPEMAARSALLAADNPFFA